MKLNKFMLATICAVLVFNASHAVAAGCYWDSGTDQLIISNVTPPGMLKLNSAVPVGSVMGSMIVGNNVSPGEASCGYFETHLFLRQGVLENGYTNVYKTNITGIGVKFWGVGALRASTLPSRYQDPNARSIVMYMTKVEFIRTSQRFGSGAVNLDFTLVSAFNDTELFELRIGGTTNLETPNHFSGCTGIEKLNIAMGRISLADLGGARQKPFNLDVLCSGAAAGTKIPVKVYFEGSSDGPGQLNLEPGGAKGVEISVLNDRGVKLPFSKGSALDMTWTRSEPDGEIYRLPVVAEYVKKAAQKVEPGKANATMNYILEYN